MAKPLDQRVALVTGASRGIGRALALDLARAGAHVIAMARTAGGLEELDDAIRAEGAEATLVPCDMRDVDAIDRLGSAVHQRWGKLDILVGNAGVLGPVTPLAHIEPKQWDELVAINVTANYRLIRSLDALLRASDAGRAVFLSSGAAQRTDLRPYWGGYAMSKAALDVLVRTYAAETATTSAIKVMSVNPGPTRTRMRAKAMPGEDPQTLRTPEDIAPKLTQLCMPSWEETGCVYDVPTDKILRFQGIA